MKKSVLFILCLLVALQIVGQNMASRYIGINLFQIPALTPNVNYTYDIKPFISPMIDLGFTPNYQSPLNMDYINFFLTPHCKCANEGYDIDKQTGGYIKIGSYFNFRKDYEKQKFFHFGLFLNNSIIHERGSYQLPPSEGPIEMPVSVEHTKYIFGLSISTGYEFRITQKMKMNFDFQASLPNKTYQDLFGYRNYIPGMGFKDDTGYWFPMLIWNLKYRI